MDQPLFVFALVLNPFEKLERFGDSAGVSPFGLENALLKLYKRVNSRPVDGEDDPDMLSHIRAEKETAVSQAFMDYLSNKGVFSEFTQRQSHWERIYVSLLPLPTTSDIFTRLVTIGS
ncbi:hypothetical protein QCA50_003572 [Cerrena zonata]|uniref:Uncharacterized protein n=1 Tax=Cerrena zonata TaxID=2478898 RepID=A0AAW0GKP0_9APHY